MLNGNTMDMYLPGKFDTKKLSQKILKNAKTAFNFCFPCSEGLFLWFTLSQLTWSDLPRAAKR